MFSYSLWEALCQHDAAELHQKPHLNKGTKSYLTHNKGQTSEGPVYNQLLPPHCELHSICVHEGELYIEIFLGHTARKYFFG